MWTLGRGARYGDSMTHPPRAPSASPRLSGLVVAAIGLNAAAIAVPLGVGGWALTEAGPTIDQALWPPIIATVVVVALLLAVPIAALARRRWALDLMVVQGVLVFLVATPVALTPSPLTMPVMFLPPALIVASGICAAVELSMLASRRRPAHFSADMGNKTSGMRG
jgi:hypothetical protein